MEQCLIAILNLVFQSLESIKKYMASPSFMKNPINNKMAKFGNE